MVHKTNAEVIFQFLLDILNHCYCTALFLEQRDTDDTVLAAFGNSDDKTTYDSCNQNVLCGIFGHIINLKVFFKLQGVRFQQ